MYALRLNLDDSFQDDYVYLNELVQSDSIEDDFIDDDLSLSVEVGLETF